MDSRLKRKRRSTLNAAVGGIDCLEPRILFSFDLTTLSSFAGVHSGVQPTGLVRDSAGNLFGTTAAGGDKGYGTIFEISATSSTIITLASFTGANGVAPHGTLVLLGDTIYGTTITGGTSSLGTIFSFVTGLTTSGVIHTVALFDGVNGTFPVSGLVDDGSGNLFGTTFGAKGKNKNSTLFEFVPNGTSNGTITKLATFKLNDRPIGGVVVDSGNVFGTTFGGGKKSLGSIYEFPSGSTASTVTTLLSLTSSTGTFAQGGLLISGGNLIGTTAAGGANGHGTIFTVHPNGTLSTITTLASFKGSDGSRPIGTMIADSSGNFYGVTAVGGTHGTGTVFEFPAGTTTSTVTSLFSFNGKTTGAYPTGPLILNESTGHFYGATFLGGTANRGTIFEIQPGVASQPSITGPAAAIGTIEILRQQSAAKVGDRLSLVVKVIDSSTTLVTVTIASGPANGNIGGTIVAHVVNGIATFTGITLTSKGAYTLKLTSGTLSVTTDSITVS